MDYQYLREKLNYFRQEHLLSFYEDLNLKEKEMLLDQLNKIDFEDIKIASTQLKLEKESNRLDVEPIAYESIDNLTDIEKRVLEARGLKLLSEKKIAVLLLAGGQGTRLGHTGPKGTVRVCNQSLFEIQAKRLRELEEATGATIPWYIMTSPINDKETREFFKDNHNFSLNPEQIFFFQQDLVPTLNSEGKIILESKGEISMSPNGNGGVYRSLQSSGALENLKMQGIEWVFFNNIDNALVKVADPLFIGFADKMGSEVSSKSVEKREPGEKVGVFCLSEGKPSVIEYTEISDIDSDSNNFVNANIGIHLFHLSFLEKIASINLPYHLAHKLIPFINESGENVKPDKPNGYKLEKFYFDAFLFAKSMSVLKVNRNKEFAPVKNKTGKDSLESAEHMLFNVDKL